MDDFEIYKGARRHFGLKAKQAFDYITTYRKAEKLRDELGRKYKYNGDFERR